MTDEFKIENSGKPIKVKLIPDLVPVDTRPVLGRDLIQHLHVNIAILGRTGQGKTTIIYNIILACAGPNTIIIVFSGSWLQDASWSTMVKELNAKGIKMVGFISTIDNKGKDILAQFVHKLQSEEKKQVGTGSMNLARFTDVPRYGRGKTYPYQQPKYILVLDDVSDEIGGPTVTALLKLSRHLKMKLICSTQYITDLQKGGRKMFGIWILLARISDDKLETIHEDASITLPLDKFIRLYHHVTKIPYEFLLIDTKDKSGSIIYRPSFGSKFLL